MLVNYNKILYCTDLSENAFHAFRHAISLAMQSNSKVHVLHVVEELSAEARVTIQAFIMKKEAREEALEGEFEMPQPSSFLIHSLKQSRQVKSARMEYFDGPVLGVLAYITSIEIEEAVDQTGDNIE